MKKIFLPAVLALLVFFDAHAQVGINILNPDSSAILQLESNNKGLGLPRLTTAEMDSIPNPLVGLTVFNTQDSVIETWNGGCWLKAYLKNCEECEFTMSINPTTDTIDRTVSDTSSITVTIRRQNGTTPVSLIYISSLPAGVSIQLNGNATIDSSGTVQVVVTVDQCLAVGGDYPIIIEAFCGDQIQFLSYNLYIRPPVQIVIPADATDYNLAAVNGLPSSPAQLVLLTVNSGVALHASVSTNPSYTTGNLDPNSVVCIVNNGAFLGAGGAGGAFTFTGGLLIAGGEPGIAGGNAMNLTTRTIIQNYGEIYGGGSGGGSVGFALSTPSIPLIGTFTIGFGFCGGGGSENGLGGVVGGAGNVTVGIFDNGGNATCCVGSIPGAGPTATYPISIPISIASIDITPTAYGGNGGGYGQQGTAGYINITLQVCVSIPIVGNICVTIPIPGGFLPYYGPTSGAPGEAIERNNNPLTGIADGTYNTPQVKGVVGP